MLLLALYAVTVWGASPLFNKNQIDVGFYDQAFVSGNIKRPPAPIFWTAKTKADKGMTVLYEHTLYHTQKYFSLNVGGDVSWWQYPASTVENLYAVSAFFDVRFWFFHSHYFSPYFTYAIAGPTWISRNYLGRAYLGKHFLFQDFMGVGANIGQHPAFNVSVKFWHYSNGDIFPRNNGFDVPIVLSLGVIF